MKSRLLATLSIFFLILTLVVFAVDRLITTEQGLLFAFNVTQKFIPGQLQINSIHGTLNSTVYLQGLRYHNADADINIDYAEIDWLPKALLQGKLAFNTLHINKLIYQTLNPKKKSSPPEFSFLRRLRINDLQLNTVLIQPLNIKLTIHGSLRQQWNIQTKIQKNNLIINGNITGAISTPNLNIQAQPGSWRFHFSNSQSYLFKWTIVTLTSQFTQQGLIGKIQIITARHQQLVAKLLLPKFTKLKNLNTEQAIEGNVNIIIPQISEFTKALPNVKNFIGNLSADIIIAGKLNKPEFSGHISLRNSSADLPEFGLHLKSISITAQGNRSQDIHWQGQAQSGPGLLQATGTTKFNSSLLTVLNLKGNNILVMHTPEYKINASPDLILKLTPKNLDLTGTVLIPKALFTIGTAETHTLTLSKDVTFVDNKKPTDTYAALPLHADILLTLGNDIQLNYQNLKTKLTGQLRLIDQPNRPTLATGQINLVHGEYAYYGQKLNISDNSQINYAGNAIDNPNLNIQATRKVLAVSSITPSSNTLTTQEAQNAVNTLAINQSTEVTVGVNVQGTAQHPVINLFANPSILSQIDTLSYLVTGQPANQLNGGNMQLLFTAANGLNPGQGKIESLMNNIQKTTGLSKVSIESTSIVNPTTNSLVQNTSLVLGKTLTPKLYITYSVGLLQPINILQINYILNKYLTLQTSSSTFSNGVDLLYKIDKK